MNVTDTDLQTAEETFQALNNAKHVESNKPEFWLWSDIAQIHNSFLDRNHLITTDYFHDNFERAVTKEIPEFQLMASKPVHVKPISNPDLNTIDSPDMEKNLDQQITRAGCEFFFQKFDNATLTQAYFLFPKASVMELAHLANEISTYHAAKKIQNVTKVFVAAVTSKTVDYDKNKTFQQIWEALWSNLFDTTDINELKAKYNIKNALTTHMVPNNWMYVQHMLQDCVNYVDIHEAPTTADIVKQCCESAQIRRHMIERHTTLLPEHFLTTTDFKKTVEKIANERKNFWLCYYPQSLRQK